MFSRAVYLLGLIPILLGVVVQVYVGVQQEKDLQSSSASMLPSGESAISLQLCFCAAISLLGYFATVSLIPSVKPLCLKAGLFGRDINKNSSDKMYAVCSSVEGSPKLLSGIDLALCWSLFCTLVHFHA
jgi:hypothetical protein